MNYREFLEKIKEEMGLRLGEECELSIQRVEKNNGVSLDGLVVFQPEKNISPTIYLNGYFVMYEQGISMDEIYDYIMETYRSKLPKENFDTDFLMEYEKVRTHVVAKLIHFEENQEMLQQVPYVKYLDLAIVFQIVVSSNTDELASILIRNQNMDLWKVSVDELYRDALENTPKQMPYNMKSLESILPPEMMGTLGLEGTDPICPLYILTNEKNINGASTILYPGLIRHIAERFESNLILLPSSIHEWLILPVKDRDEIQNFDDMVQEVNRTQLKTEEILSDHAYLYDRETDEIDVTVSMEFVEAV